MRRILSVLVILSPLALVFAGCWMLNPALGLIALGLLIWIDLNKSDKP